MRQLIVALVSSLALGCLDAKGTLQVDWEFENDVNSASLQAVSSEDDHVTMAWRRADGDTLELVLEHLPREGWVKLSGHTDRGPDEQLCGLFTAAERQQQPLLSEAYFPAGIVNVDFNLAWEDDFLDDHGTCVLKVAWDKDTVWVAHDPYVPPLPAPVNGPTNPSL